MGLSEVMLSDHHALDDRESVISMLETIHSAGDDARRIVRRLRQIYKEQEPDYSLIDLAAVTESVLSMTMSKWKAETHAKGLNIEIVTEFGDVPSIKGDASELREALTNLIFNAVDAMPAGGVITLSVKCEGKSAVLLEVSDTGVGMDADTAQHCIEPFFTTKGVQGTGLGLPMVYGIVQRHSGSMTITGAPGVGTTVRMQFPVPVDQKPLMDDTVKDIAALPPLHVLIIDDESRSRDFISTMLKSDGHTTRLAEGGQAGVDLCRREQFDLVITDRAMPLMHGDVVAAEIARDRPAMPVIMLTGFGDIMQDKGECPDGVTRVVSKPVTRMDLRHVMAWSLQRAGSGTCDQGDVI
jgi:CheY-like chemotaxis protein